MSETIIPPRGTKEFNEYAASVMLSDEPKQYSFKGSYEWGESSSPIWDWRTYDYRIAPKPKCVPYTMETCPTAMWVRRKSDRSKFAVIAIMQMYVVLGNGHDIRYEYLASDYEHLDGSYCGTEVQP